MSLFSVSQGELVTKKVIKKILELHKYIYAIYYTICIYIYTFPFLMYFYIDTDSANITLSLWIIYSFDMLEKHIQRTVKQAIYRLAVLNLILLIRNLEGMSPFLYIFLSL